MTRSDPPRTYIEVEDVSVAIWADGGCTIGFTVDGISHVVMKDSIAEALACAFSHVYVPPEDLSGAFNDGFKLPSFWRRWIARF